MSNSLPENVTRSLVGKQTTQAKKVYEVFPLGGSIFYLSFLSVLFLRLCSRFTKTLLAFSQ